MFNAFEVKFICDYPPSWAKVNNNKVTLVLFCSCSALITKKKIKNEKTEELNNSFVFSWKTSSFLWRKLYNDSQFFFFLINLLYISDPNLGTPNRCNILNNYILYWTIFSKDYSYHLLYNMQYCEHLLLLISHSLHLVYNLATHRIIWQCAEDFNQSSVHLCCIPFKEFSTSSQEQCVT